MVDIKLTGPRGSRQGQPDFHQLRSQLLSLGKLFEDDEFPATENSMYFSKEPPRNYEWKRPMDISKDPQLFVDGSTRFDVQQGELGDCWLVAALANLTLNSVLFDQVVPPDQGFGANYAGIFHFRFWQYGKWVEVVIDDRLPTFRGKLAFLHSSEPNEFWSALLEKAYAKLHGSYEALNSGTLCDAMVDFTGGVMEMYELDQAPPNLFKIMLNAYLHSSFMGCSVAVDGRGKEAQTTDGLVTGHAYSVTGVRYASMNSDVSDIPLIRLRNPWGNATEWNGDWSDKSAMWELLPLSEKLEMQLTVNDDGEFWMSYYDFKVKFNMLEICNLNPELLGDVTTPVSGKKKWQMSLFKGEWVQGVTAGGCRNSLESFVKNPQYRVTLDDHDENDDDNKCTIIVSLMQKNRLNRRSKKRQRLGMECLTIGFSVFSLSGIKNPPTPLDMDFFENNRAVQPTPCFMNIREVSFRYRLPPGTYCIVPSTFHPHEEGKFILRVFSETNSHMIENDEVVSLGEVDVRIIDKPEPENKVEQFFRIIAGEDMELNWEDLKVVLNYAMREDDPVYCHTFSTEVCRSMVALMDSDRSGKLGWDEFGSLWTEIRNSKSVFKLYDTDKSKSLSAFELRQALNSAGYRLNNHILNILAHRYCTKGGTITFDDFMMCAVRLKAMIDVFRERDPKGIHAAEFTMDEWIEKTMYS